MARYRKYTIAYGDTIQSIAQHTMGSVMRWQEIIEYNDLHYPFVVDTLAEKLKDPDHLVTIGDLIVIPVIVDLLDTDVDSLGHRDRELILGLALGRDLAMDYAEESAANKALHGEIMGLSATANGNIKTVQGVENLRQAVIARLLTPQGSLLMHPNYGSRLYELVGRPANTETLVMMDNEITSTIQKDGRVEGVELINSRIEEDTYHGEFNINLHSLDEYFVLVIESESGGSFAIY